MANEEINDQTAKTTPADTDEYLLQETGGGTNKKITRANMLKSITFLNVGSTVNIAIDGSGAVTATKSALAVSSNSPGNPDNLDTISGTSDGDIIFVSRTSTDTITLRDGVDNLSMAGDFALDAFADEITFHNRGGTLYELSRSSNA